VIARPASATARIIPALDTGDLARADALAGALAPHCGLLKVGLELFCAAGAPAVTGMSRHRPVFLDVKLHDIPNTVAGALRSLLPLRPAMVTLHAGGGPAMLAAARAEAEKVGAERPILLAVTVLTSLGPEELAEITPSPDSLTERVLRLARLAWDSGCDGLVCAPVDLVALRGELGAEPLVVTPGIRPAGAVPDDQTRVATAREARDAGADFLVVGRPVTRAADPAAALAALAAELVA